MSEATILVVDDESDIRSLIMEILSDEGYKVEVAADGAEARAKYSDARPDMVLLDVWMPDVDGITLLKEWSESDDHLCPVVIMSGHGTVETAIEATRLGAVDYIEKPLSLAQLLRTVDGALTASSGKPQSVARKYTLQEPVGKSDAVLALKEQCQVIAGHAAPLLITGEGGSGRESIARYIHSLSDRSSHPFILVAGSSLDEQRGDKALFGDESGNAGLLETAGNGTLFISELQQIAPATQKSLQGVLRQGFYIAGTGEQHPLDVRITASILPGTAAHETLDSMLLDAVAALKMRTPSLRDYREDVPELLRHYVDELVEEESLQFRHFGVAAQNRLRNYPWPGNIRELRQFVRQLLLQGGDEEISLIEIESLLDGSEQGAATVVQQDLLALPLREAREAFEREYLGRQLKLCGGKVGKLAERVGMERTHLYRKLRSLDIDFRQVANED